MQAKQNETSQHTLMSLTVALQFAQYINKYKIYNENSIV